MELDTYQASKQFFYLFDASLPTNLRLKLSTFPCIVLIFQPFLAHISVVVFSRYILERETLVLLSLRGSISIASQVLFNIDNARLNDKAKHQLSVTNLAHKQVIVFLDVGG